MLDDDEILNDFLEEAREHLEGIEEDLLEIERMQDSVDAELVNKIFRGMHSIKGAAGFLELKNIESVAHSLETLLSKVGKGQLVPHSGVINPCLTAMDCLSSMIDDVTSSNDRDVSQILSDLQAAQEEESSAEIQVETDSTEQAESEPPKNVEAAPAEPKEEQADLPKNDDLPKKQPNSEPGHSDEGSLRVPLKTLNNLMTLASELVLTRNQLLESLKSNDTSKIQTAAFNVDSITSDLQLSIMNTRMQPIGKVFNRFNRVVRDLAKVLGKEVSLTLVGQDVELDKTIIESIADPLTHLIRNAVDHGIELPAEREASGKPPCGLLQLRAMHKAGHVVVEVQDDGKGIDANRIREKAIQDGILDRAALERMPENEILRLIFRSGFSMAKKVTQISGRGVGMDVVYTNFSKLGGTVDIESTVGQGSLIRVKLPLTLAIIPSLFVSVEEEQFAIPQANLAELVSLDPTQAKERVREVGGSYFLEVRDGLLPLLSLAPVLRGRDETDDPGKIPQNIAIVFADNLRFGLIVDEFLDSEEIVVKPLGYHIQSVPTYCGATIRGDGQVALILSILGIGQTLNLSEEQIKHVAAAKVNEVAQAHERLPTLILKGPLEEQLAAPLELISGIERIESTQLEKVADRLCLCYPDRRLPLITTDGKDLDIEQAPSTLYVLIFPYFDGQVGLIANQIVDAIDIEEEVDNHTFVRPGVLGSVIVGGRTTLLLDLPEMVRLQLPETFLRDPFSSTEQKETADPLKVLVVDDSNFYRQQIAKFVTEGGAIVSTAVDGLDALDKLQEQKVDLLLTDIEMPNMNGIELIQQVRKQNDYLGLPIVAITSLSGEDIERQIVNAGANKYMLKLAKDQILKLLNQYKRIKVGR